MARKITTAEEELAGELARLKNVLSALNEFESAIAKAMYKGKILRGMLEGLPNIHHFNPANFTMSIKAGLEKLSYVLPMSLLDNVRSCLITAKDKAAERLKALVKAMKEEAQEDQADVDPGAD